MPTNTYVALDKVTLTSNASDVTFSSIPSGYTDLVVFVTGASTTAGSSTNGLRWQINGDTGSNYSEIQIYADGSTATSTNATSATDIGAGLLMQTSAGYFATNIIQFMNYSNTTTYKTILTRNGGASVSTAANVASWRSTSAINSIKFYRLSDQLKSGSTFELYGIRAEGVSPTTKATGGVIYSDSTYYYHVFGASGTFTPTQSITADVLVVAGGGGGSAAGGGAGGLRFFSSQALSATGYTVTVGGGGALGNSGSGLGATGGDSQFGALTISNGGGGGANYGDVNSTVSGGSGGSGGGGTSRDSTSSGAGGSASPSGQGNAGGSGLNSSAGAVNGGGGGGAGAVGGNTSFGSGGSGGVGLSTYSSWGTATGTGENVSGTYYYAGGGRGESNFSSSLGSNGYGNGSSSTGGGGMSASSGGGNGFAGQSGVVIVRYIK